MKEIIVVSACLCGIRSRYDGKSKHVEEIRDLVDKGLAIPLCPEMLGGLPVPRPKATLKDKKVVNEKGEDVTEPFKRGAERFVSIVEKLGIKRVIMKDGSPSCGVIETNRNWKKVKGSGITTSLIKKRLKGIQIEFIR